MHESYDSYKKFTQKHERHWESYLSIILLHDKVYTTHLIYSI